MTAPLCTLDLARMRRDRIAKVRAAMVAAEVDVLVLCGQNNVSYATGVRSPAADHMRAAWWRPIVVFGRDDEWPTVYTEFPEGAPPEWPDECLHAAIEVEARDGARDLVARLPQGGKLAIDDAPFPLWEQLCGRDPVDASAILTAAKLTKTLDELECVRQAQMLNERAIRDIRPVAVPGAHATDCSGAFLQAIAELGATSNTVDPVFQVMPPSIADGAYSLTGEPVYPLPTRPQELREGDVVWVDTGINLYGYASDFGATWIIGGAADDRPRKQWERWREVADRALSALRPGATAADLVDAAGHDHDAMPWLSYFYLAHGIGTDSAEMPFIGTDRGRTFDEALRLVPGMVIVLEPVIWDDGYAGHRSEEIVAVTDDGYTWLSSRAEFDETGGA